ncbi:hypothetical protein E0Z10_g4620 [Xylaria hypoxylon]|uniref:Uncharacterized protein n=1 Tax=Xylaria hypoxylon TaxID=37992 RepID=A0A4Z0YW39_9PEZI|nr:hypothetical protein E0Z10_g4620 [Xylaria hypoxylon]
MPTPSSPESGDDTVGPSIGLKVGLGVGITAGVILIIALCSFGFVRRYRKRMAWKMQRYQKDGLEGITPVGSVEVDKPELAGSAFLPLYGKAELDPLATRAELEAPSEEGGAGIFIRKPELPGSDPLTKRGVLGAYVKRKGELEAFPAKLGGSQATAS